MTDENENKEEKEQQESKYADFGAFLAEQSDDVKGLYETELAGLKSALEKERTARKQATETISTLKTQVEKGSESEKQLEKTLAEFNELKTQAEQDARRAKFYEQATGKDIGCSNVKATYAIAVANNLFDKDGVPNWTELKKLAPELFIGKAKNHAGKTGDELPSTADINAEIRQAAGF